MNSKCDVKMATGKGWKRIPALDRLQGVTGSAVESERFAGCLL